MCHQCYISSWAIEHDWLTHTLKLTNNNNHLAFYTVFMLHETLTQQLPVHQLWVFSIYRSSERNLPYLKLNWTITKLLIHKQLKFTYCLNITRCDIIYTKFITITNQLTPKDYLMLATINPKTSVTDVLPAKLKTLNAWLP